MGLADFVPEDAELDSDKEEYPDEAVVEELIVDHFEELDFKNVYGDNDHGLDIPDVIAVDDDVTWGVEVKGDAKSNKQRIYSALGQVVYQMDPDDIETDELKWGIAFPDSIDSREQYRKRINQNVSREILEMLSIHVLFVQEDGEVEVNPPGKIGS